MSNFKMLPVDGEKLDAEFQKRGLSLSQVAREIGYSTTAVSFVRTRGTDSRAMITLFRSIYNIDYDKIKPDDHEGVAEDAPIPKELYPLVCAAVSATISAHKDELYKIAYAAATAAFETCLNN